MQVQKDDGASVGSSRSSSSSSSSSAMARARTKAEAARAHASFADREAKLKMFRRTKEDDMAILKTMDEEVYRDKTNSWVAPLPFGVPRHLPNNSEQVFNCLISHPRQEARDERAVCHRHGEDL